jgi:hypothetical protein
MYGLMEKRVLVAITGTHKNVVLFTPPMCFTIENARSDGSLFFLLRFCHFVFITGFFLDFCYVLYSTLLHLPPLRFRCVGGCWDRTQDCCDFGIGSQTPFFLPTLIFVIFLFFLFQYGSRSRILPQCESGAASSRPQINPCDCGSGI